jgi:hypothetical protein
MAEGVSPEIANFGKGRQSLMRREYGGPARGEEDEGEECEDREGREIGMGTVKERFDLV